ncbi:hypothetical protein CABS01_01825 [Colletotrichum abscissum]|uniref:Uncharacterized protein n=4 Tax=Colletotrichum acutatum species complex TaxID=2707335 RepID=A0A9Q8SX21_9PEZI|nr:uncharacterized protein CLUP02_10516 [Colletotrichum lupini]XP_060315914.1 uncharacterized protein CCOS01_05968 [Colletotrichum costaricense]XP_060388172.1 uncharacterized protein CTAM01_00661 [Colletotrichum tamarilloi]XP_060398393.1 uncharacterized protein CABS01_01825 [Colletotrichum abscissum]KAI3542466.1 hypothetical protein CSPX01_06944 [Colletotrichum filicis]KAK1452469.1 hypothetical protein CCUS01_10946 [Colletotrichum cuscutae]KAK1496018.1 hypothetical protein CABS01_01825 [Colle
MNRGNTTSSSAMASDENETCGCIDDGYSGRWDFRTCTHCGGHERNPCKTCDSRGVVRVPCPHGAAGQAQALSSRPRADDQNNKPGPKGPTGPTGPGQGVAGAGCH